jgi:hypothetical protein
MNEPSSTASVPSSETQLCTKLKRLGACQESLRWVEKFDNPQAAWAACERGDWMLWLLGKLSGPPCSTSRKAVVAACCECARLALPRFESVYPHDKRPRTAIETAERHCKGEADLNEVERTAAAAYAAYAAAAYAAAYAAVADYAAVYAFYAVDAAFKTKRPTKCADIVRKHFPQPPTLP